MSSTSETTVPWDGDPWGTPRSDGSPVDVDLSASPDWSFASLLPELFGQGPVDDLAPIPRAPWSDIDVWTGAPFPEPGPGGAFYPPGIPAAAPPFQAPLPDEWTVQLPFMEAAPVRSAPAPALPPPVMAPLPEPEVGLATSVARAFDGFAGAVDAISVPLEAFDPTVAPPPGMDELKNVYDTTRVIRAGQNILTTPTGGTESDWGAGFRHLMSVAAGPAVGMATGDPVAGQAVSSGLDMFDFVLNGAFGADEVNRMAGQPFTRVQDQLLLANELLLQDHEVPTRIDHFPTEPALDMPAPTPALEGKILQPPSPLDMVGDGGFWLDAGEQPANLPWDDSWLVKDGPAPAPSVEPHVVASDPVAPVAQPVGGGPEPAASVSPALGLGEAAGWGAAGGAVGAFGTDLYRRFIGGEDVGMGEMAGDTAVGAGVGAVTGVASEGLSQAVVAAGGSQVLGSVLGGGIVDGVVSGVTSTLSNGAAYEAGDVDAAHASANVLVDTGIGLGAGLAGAATGAAAGAAIGSVVPIAGTALGTVVGAGAGLAGGIVGAAGFHLLAEGSGFGDWARQGLGDQLTGLEQPLGVGWDAVNGGIDGAMTGAMVGGAGGAAMGAMGTGASAAALGFMVGGPVGALLAGGIGAGVGGLTGGLLGAGVGLAPGAMIGAGLGLGEGLTEWLGTPAPVQEM